VDDRADLLLLDGKILTLDDARPRARAIAVREGRIVAVGDDAAVGRLGGPRTRVIALHGRTVLTALTDGHAHLYGLGRALAEVDLRDCASPADCAARVAAAARGRPAGEWILGRGWDQNLFPGARFPTHDALDAVVADRPVWVRRIDGHAGWANARAMSLAGLTTDRGAPPDPAGGRIERDGPGRPTGVLVDAAMGIVERAIPSPPGEERERAILRAQSEALAHGLTEVHEMGIDGPTIDAYRRLDRQGHLKLRVYAYADGTDRALRDRLLAGPPDPTPPEARFVLRGIKLFADGALGSRGAALLAPYTDDPTNRGLRQIAEADLADVARRALATGWQVAVHAIGDAANRMVLDAFAAAGCTPARDHRFRIEHAQVVALEDLPRFAALGVVASMQPTHATRDMPWAEARLGHERLAGAYAWRRMLDAGAHLVAGSDFPVERVDAIGGGLYAAVTRQDRAGRPPGGWLPEQRLTLVEAARAFGSEASWAAFEERWRGRAGPGMAADLTVLDRDVLDAPPTALLEARVDLTIIGGRVDYERDPGRVP
jgi:predicted amidohydrolase YtcJ